MEIYNDGLPEIIYQAVLESNAQYDPGDSDFTTTGLLAPAWQRYLSKKHKDTLKIPASSQLYQMDGTALHSLLEKAGRKMEGWIIEKRFKAHFNGVSVSGQIDAYDPKTKTLFDYKRCAVSQWMYEPKKQEHAEQLNINATILWANEIEVENLVIVLYFRDFSKPQVGKKDGYPTQQIVAVKHDLWPQIKTAQLIEERIHAHLNPVPCTDGEKWCKFRVVKEGRKTALKRADSAEEAYMWISQNVSSLEVPYISVVPTEPMRCKLYCSVNSVCEHWNDM